MTPKPWVIMRSDWVVDAHWYRLRKDVVQLPDGRTVDDYFVSVRPDVAIMVPIDRDGQMILVRQYKHGIGSICLEFPAGTFQDGRESAEAAARRELMEETGYRPGRVQPLGVAIEDATRNSNRVHMFLALDCERAGEQALDENEQSSGIEVVRLPLATLRETLNTGAIAAMSSLVAGYRALDRIGG